MRPRILLIEDDEALARGLGFNLEREGFEVVRTATGEEGRALGLAGGHDLILLDLTLPDLDGTEVLRALRSAGSPAQVICLTARGGETDVVMGLDLGADDYVTKPFGLAELVSRIKARLRRGGNGGADHPDVLRLGTVRVDFASRRAEGPDGPRELTPIECDLLRYLAARPGVAVDRQDLLRDLWGVDHNTPTRTLDNHMARLRRKVESDPSDPRHLVTVHGQGYRFDP